MKVCNVNACTDAAQARGMCWMHFGRFRRNGDPLASGQHGGHTAPSPTAAPDPGPLLVLRLELEKARASEITFTAAWEAALTVAIDGLPDSDSDDWMAVLAVTRDVWRAAYDRAGEPFALSAPEDEPSGPRGRSGPPLVLTGQRHDGPSTLEPVEVPWCR